MKNKRLLVTLLITLCVYVNKQNNNWNFEHNTDKHTCDSYGKKAMLISFKVLIFFAAHDLHSSLKSSSGQTAVQQLHNIFIGTYKKKIDFKSVLFTPNFTKKKVLARRNVTKKKTDNKIKQNYTCCS